MVEKRQPIDLNEFITAVIELYAALLPFKHSYLLAYTRLDAELDEDEVPEDLLSLHVRDSLADEIERIKDRLSTINLLKFPTKKLIGIAAQQYLPKTKNMPPRDEPYPPAEYGHFNHVRRQIDSLLDVFEDYIIGIQVAEKYIDDDVRFDDDIFDDAIQGSRTFIEALANFAENYPRVVSATDANMLNRAIERVRRNEL